MPRAVKKKKKPLRGSVRQNTMIEEESGGFSFEFGFGARLALLIIGAIAVIMFAAWLWRGEWPRKQAQWAAQTIVRATQKSGFAVKDVLVQGRQYTDRDDLFAALGVQAGSPTFTFDPEDAYQKIMALPWTDSVTVLRSMPDTIIIRLTEREPIARWQHEDKTVVIDGQGREIKAAKAEQFPNLPLVVGNQAGTQTKALLAQLREFPVVMQVLKAAVRVGERRWNFYIQPNLLIRLPEQDIGLALTKLTQLIKDQKVTDRNIVAIDLRLPDRMIIEPGQQPAAPQLGDKSE